MIITKVETILLSIPFEDGGKGEGLTPTRWADLDILMVRIETNTGLVGWGEGFGYVVAPATKHVIDNMIAPLLIGKELTNPAAISEELQLRLSLFGRFGITIFALSGVDIALWDLVSKAAGKSLADYLGGAKRTKLQAYASLVRYGDVETAQKFTRQAVEEGFTSIKLHEIELPEILACRAAAPDVDMTVDVNCNWSAEQAAANTKVLTEQGIYWLEEPTFPPEDFAKMAKLNKNIAIAAGENLCTASQFVGLIESGAVKYVQPSVTKVGGVTEFVKIADMASAAGLSIMPHSPYFGPGYHATLQLAAAKSEDALLEYLYVWPEALPDPNTPLAKDGFIALPKGLGIGFEPAEEVIAKYRVQ